MRIVSVVGARPQFVKLAPICRAAAKFDGVEHLIVHTGQHYDRAMSDTFFEEFGIPEPDVQLGIGSGSHGEQTGAMLAALDPALSRLAPDWTLVYGDTNSTLAAAIAARKMGLPVAHLEAGLRSYNRAMPEEVNRVLTDHASDLLLSPTKHARDCLQAEGLGERAVVVGDVMADICLETAREVVSSGRPLRADLPGAGPFLLATIHRAENTDSKDRLRLIIDRLSTLRVPTVLAVHPRLAKQSAIYGIRLDPGPLLPVPPLGYRDLVRAVMSSSGVITDSGGLQKEAYLLGVPCRSVRAETEWPETLAEGWNQLDPDLSGLDKMTAGSPVPTGSRRLAYGDGHAADRVLQTLLRETPGCRRSPGEYADPRHRTKVSEESGV